MPKLVDALLEDQRKRWFSGDGAPVEQYLAEHPALADDEEGIVDLVYQEFVLRAQLGESPDAEDYFRRFPRHRTALEAQLAFLNAMQRVGNKPTMTRAPARPAWFGGEAIPIGGAPRLEPSLYTAAELPRLDGYEIQAAVGSGATSVVYKAWHSALRRRVAIKFIHATGGMEPEARARFIAEAEAVARLHHPSVVQIYEVGEQDGRPFLAMEFVDGGTLAERIAKGPLVAREAAQLMMAVARAVQHAHSRGVIHRDLKPANILLQEENKPTTAGDPGTSPSRGLPSSLQPKITDFGLAKQLDTERGHLTKSGAVLGTPSYMAPEQASGNGRDAGPSADIYALGAILYEMLTGRPPFLADTPLATLQQVIEHEPLAPTSLQPALPRDLGTICLKCLEKDPHRRYASAAALAEDLERFQRGESIRARPAGLLECGWRWCRRRPLAASLAATAASLLVLVLVSAAISVYEWRQSVELAQQERSARLRAEEIRDIATRLVLQLAAVGDVPLSQDHEAHRRHQSDVLRQAESFCLELLKEPQPGDEIRLTLAKVYDRLCPLYISAKARPPAQQAVEKAIAQWQVLAEANPGNADYELGLARAERQLAVMHEYRRDWTNALILFRRGHNRMRPHVARSDSTLALELINFKQHIASCFGNLVPSTEALAMLREARDYGLSSLNECREPALRSTIQLRLAGIHKAIGGLLAHLGDSVEAQKAWNQARALYRQTLTEDLRAAPKLELPRNDVLAYKEEFAECCITAAQFAGGSDEDYREASELLEELCRERSSLSHEDPGTVSLMLGQRHYRLAQCYQAQCKIPAALKACHASVQHCEDALRRRPADCDAAQLWLESLGRLATLQEKSEHHAEATATLRRLTEGIEQQVCSPRTDRVQRTAVASSLADLSANLRTIPANVQALEAAKGSQRVLEQLAVEAPAEIAYQNGLSRAWGQMAACYWRFDDHEQVLHACRQAMAISRRVCEQDPENIEYRGLLDVRHVKLERILGQMKRRGEILESILEREKLWAGNSERLQAVARDLRKLADSVSDGKTELTPAEQTERQSYLDHSARVERAVNRASADRH